MSDLPVRVITPYDGMDAFRHAITSMRRDWACTRELAWRMFVRDTKSTFRGSFLGWLWLLLPAIGNTLVWVFLSGNDVIKINSADTPYPLFVFVGTLLWTAFNGALVAGLGVVDEAKGMLAKVNFPHEALVLAAFGKSSLNTAANAVALVPFLLLYPVTVRSEMLLFVPGLLLTSLTGLSLGLIVVPISALANDVSRGIHLLLRFAFFLTPVIFPLPTEGPGRLVMLLNPASSLVVTSRSWLTGGEPPVLLPFLIVSAGGVVLLAVGLLALKVALPHIIERLSGT
jgi:lipopolysaccharide transport system permease protein